MQALVDAYADLAKIWRDRMAEIRRRLIAQFPPQPADDRELQQLGAAIQEIEELAESRAAESSRQFKKRNRYIGRFDASMARIYGHAAEQLHEINQQMVEAMLDFALLMRAVRAEADPESRGGPTFENPEDLRRYLNTELT
ncbi:MAG: hypothetical protein JOY94_05260 [Methylobacteriaceae bacterium]|nr:hypothetical protein [Methylobacteriaceae bacterium]